MDAKKNDNTLVHDLNRINCSTVTQDYRELIQNRIISRTLCCIQNETEDPGYILYRGDYINKLDPERAYKHMVSFSDGLFSGFVFDGGASAFTIAYKTELQSALSPKEVNLNALWQISLDRVALLNCKLPVFIPAAHPILSALGSGELFHSRTKVLYYPIEQDESGVNKTHMSTMGIDSSVITYQYKNIHISPETTPEFFTTSNPKVLIVKECLWETVYENTDRGTFDNEGAEAIKALCDNIKQVPLTK